MIGRQVSTLRLNLLSVLLWTECVVNLTTFLFLLLVIVCSPQIKAFAGNEVALENAYLRWEELEKQGNYHEALPYAEQALRLEKEFDPYSKYVGESLNYIGVLYQRLGKYAEAEKSTDPTEYKKVATVMKNYFLMVNYSLRCSMKLLSGNKLALQICGHLL